MWECGSWHDSILVEDQVYQLEELPEKLQLKGLADAHLQRCAQVNKEMFLLVYQTEPEVETYCFFNPLFEVIVEEKRAINKYEQDDYPQQ